jgi:protoporphyrinogen oxidase
MARLIVIGAGAMGLAAAYHASKAGHEVEVIEAGAEPGGMAAHFDLDGLSIERFYHFICKTDAPTFALLRELGIADALRWRPTSMGYFDGATLHPWGDPISLLRFPKISLLSRLRYGLFAFICTRRERWDAIEHETAQSWITRWCGTEVYKKLWRPLFDLKFYEYADDISAAWIWTRVKRIGRSRRSLFQEELGYLEGGSLTLVKRLCDAIREAGGTITLRTPALRVQTKDGRVTGVETPAGTIAADAVICTVPTPLVPTLVPDLPEEWRQRYEAIANIGVCCLVFRLKRPVSPHFWINIVEKDGVIPGLIEFSNLRPVGGSVVYVPYYMPVSNPKFGWSDQALLDEAFAVIQRVNPALTRDDVEASRVARLRHAQPVCEPGFAAKIPPVETPIRGLQIADTCFYYPEDRGISESVRFGREMAARVAA